MAVYRTSSGTKFFISTTVPPAATDTITELEALTYTEVTGITNLGDYGDEANLVDLEVLGDGRVRHLMGARDAGTMNITVAHDKYDAGQKAMRLAMNAGQEYAFKIELLDGIDPDPGTKQYFIGPVTNQRQTVGDNGSVLGRTFDVSNNSGMFEDDGLGP